MDGQASPIWKVTFQQSWKLVRKVAVQIFVEECSRRGGEGAGLCQISAAVWFSGSRPRGRILCVGHFLEPVLGIKTCGKEQQLVGQK